MTCETDAMMPMPIRRRTISADCTFGAAPVRDGELVGQADLKLLPPLRSSSRRRIFSFSCSRRERAGLPRGGGSCTSALWAPHSSGKVRRGNLFVALVVFVQINLRGAHIHMARAGLFHFVRRRPGRRVLRNGRRALLCAGGAGGMLPERLPGGLCAGAAPPCCGRAPPCCGGRAPARGGSALSAADCTGFSFGASCDGPRGGRAAPRAAPLQALPLAFGQRSLPAFLGSANKDLNRPDYSPV